MAKYKKATLTAGKLIIDNRKIDENEARNRIRSGKNVYGSKKNASSLAESLSDGQGSMRHASHVLGGYHHYHDINHNYNGHIFYGEPHYGQAD